MRSFFMSKSAAAIISAEDAPKVRKLLTEVLSTFNGYAVELGEPFLGMFQDLKAQYNAILEKLPLTDAVPAAQEASWHLSGFLSCMTSTQALLNFMGGKLNELKTRNSAAPSAEAIAVEVEKVITQRVNEGKLFAADKVTTLCSDAKAQGITQGEQNEREKINQEKERIKTIESRKTALTTNSLPLPSADEMLGGTDEEYAAKKTTAEARVAKLKEKGVALNSPLMKDVWGTDAEFAVLERVVASYHSGTPGAPGASLDTRPPGGNAEDKKPVRFAL